ncbi:MAG: hypothetical protein M1815_003698 [Lichina confinis]|nr:MAG: hypothetical protein M1815_003698 [Lichina confinis]
MATNQIKSQSLWETHLRSPSHLTRAAALGKGKLAGVISGQLPGDEHKKRKTQHDDADVEQTDEGRKRARGEDQSARKRPKANVDGLPEGSFDAQSDPEEDEDQTGPEESRDDADEEKRVSPVPQADGHESDVTDDQQPVPPSNSLPADFFDQGLPSQGQPRDVAEPPPKMKANDVDEDEWTQFEQDIAATALETVGDGPTSRGTLSVLAAPSTISAPAVSAADLAMVSPAGPKNAEDETQRRRDREREMLEEDEEDAKRRLEEEFDAMESLEARLSKLKVKREALRARIVGGGGEGQDSGHSRDRGKPDDAAEPETGQRQTKHLADSIKKSSDAFRGSGLGAEHVHESGEDDDDDEEDDPRWSRWE